MSGIDEDPLGASGAGLRQVVEAIWSPARAGVTVTIGSRRTVHTPCVERYLVLPHPRRPRLLLPAGDLPAARRAVGAYRGLRTAKAEAWSVAIRAGTLSTPVGARLLAELRVYDGGNGRRLLPELARLLDVDGLRAMLAVREAGPHTKPTVGLLDDTGRPLAYAKVGCSPQTDAMVRTEAATLREIAGRLPSITTPALLAETEWLGHPVGVLEPLPREARRLTTEPFDMVSTLREVAASGRPHESTLRESGYADRLSRRLTAVEAADPDVVAALRDWLAEVVRSDAVLPFGRSHGDWVSWNLGTADGRVVAWDWERSVPDAPVGFDACHWYFQRAREKAGLEAGVAAVDEIAPGLTRIGVPADHCARVAGLYLVSAFVAEVESATAKAPERHATIAAIAGARTPRRGPRDGSKS